MIAHSRGVSGSNEPNPGAFDAFDVSGVAAWTVSESVEAGSQAIDPVSHAPFRPDVWTVQRDLRPRAFSAAFSDAWMPGS